jgi:hypothetical protein
MQTVLTPAIIEHWEVWPTFHNNTTRCTVNYDKPFLMLMHDEEAYNQLFTKKFPDLNVVEQLHAHKLRVEDRKNLYPITYFAERLPI